MRGWCFSRFSNPLPLLAKRNCCHRLVLTFPRGHILHSQIPPAAAESCATFLPTSSTLAPAAATRRAYSSSPGHEEEEEVDQKQEFFKSPRDRLKQDFRSYRNLFLLKVHPDLFSENPEIRAINQKSLKSLNALLKIVTSFASSHSNVDTRTFTEEKHDFHFYLKHTQENSKEYHIQEIRIPFDASTAKANPHALRKHAEQFLAELFMQAGIVERPKPRKDLPRMQGWVQTDWSEGRFNEKMKEALRFAPMMGERKLSRDEELMAMFNPDMIFFAGGLTEREKGRAVSFLFKNLEKLSYDAWGDLPIMIGKQFARDLEGFVAIPYNSTVPQVLNHLNKHLPTIKKEREKIVREAHLFADLSERLNQLLHTNGVSVLGPKRTAISTLERLVSIAGKLSTYNWEDTNLVIMDSGASDDTKRSQQQGEDEDEGEQRRFISSTNSANNQSEASFDSFKSQLQDAPSSVQGDGAVVLMVPTCESKGKGSAEPTTSSTTSSSKFWIDSKMNRICVARDFRADELLAFLKSESEKELPLWPFAAEKKKKSALQEGEPGHHLQHQLKLNKMSG